MSEQVEKRLVTMLPEFARSPYGNPVPGLEDLGVEAAPETAVVSLSTVAATSVGSTVTIAWFAEPLQVDTYLLAQFRETGVMPGTEVEVVQVGEYITLRAGAHDTVLDLPVETASHVFVRS